MNRIVTPSLLAVALLATALPGALAGPLDDNDGDRVADLGEAAACGSSTLAFVITTAGLGKVWCASGTNLDYDLVVTVPVPVPVNAFLGTDADQDDIPGTLVVEQVTVTFDPKTGDVVTTSAAASRTFNVDPNDANKDDPAATQIALGEHVKSIIVGPDRDGDLFPSAVTVTRESWTFDRQQKRVVVGPATSLVVPIDPNDNDPDDPVSDFADQDHDRVPDALEPTLCGIQNNNFPQDGTCVGSDYTPPPIPGTDVVDRFTRGGININRPDLWQ